MIFPLDNKINTITVDKDTICADIEKKEKIWKFTSITFATIIVLFCLLVGYGYTMVNN